MVKRASLSKFRPSLGAASVTGKNVVAPAHFDRSMATLLRTLPAALEHKKRSCPGWWCSSAVAKPPASAPYISAVASGRLRGGHRRFPVGLGCDTNLNRETTDDRRDDDPSRAAGEELRRRPAARDDRLCRAAADGAGGRRPDRRRPRRDAAPSGSTSATATASATGRPAPAPSSCASRSCARAATSRASSSRAGWPRRR